MLKKKDFFTIGILFLFLSLVSVFTYATSVTAVYRGTLPNCLTESSSLDFTGGSSFWSLNDSGDKELYKVSNSGIHTATIDITNCSLRNWEALAHNATRTYMYIGDIGNNGNDRTNLRVYRIPYPSTIIGTTAAAEEITFSYSDQTRFPASWMNFDAEAMIHFQGKIYIFTKADGNAIGYTKMYKLSDAPGNHVAMLVDSFYTNDRTTSADISADGTSLVLISNTKIHLFRNFSGDDFFGGQYTKISISGSWTQKEGVSFSTNNEIFISDEGSPGKLYHVDLSQWIPAAPIYTNIESITDDAVKVYPIPANNFVNVAINSDLKVEKLSFVLFDLTGKVVYQARIDNIYEPFSVATEDFPSGIYFYKLFDDAREVKSERLIINH
jgi:hypothetical protein